MIGLRAHTFGACLAAALAALPPGARAADSAFTPLDLRACRDVTGKRDVDRDGQGGYFLCKGLDGWPVLVAEGDLRFAVSYGRDARTEPAAREFTAAFSHLGRTIEWRGERAGGRFVPYATILRVFVTWPKDDGSNATGQTLVVTRLPPGPVCRVGAVDALLNADANALAVQIADELARGFRCGTDRPVVRGRAGRAIDGLGLYSPR